MFPLRRHPYYGGPDGLKRVLDLIEAACPVLDLFDAPELATLLGAYQEVTRLAGPGGGAPAAPAGPAAYRSLTNPSTGYGVAMTDPQYARGDDGLTGPPGPPPAGDPGYPATGPAGTTGPGQGQAGPGTGEQPPPLTIDRTRTSGLWASVIAAAVVLLLLLIFILQNTEQVEVSLFGAHPDLPLGVALLLAAVLGALIVALVGTARIVQLRVVARRHRGADRAASGGRRGLRGR